MSVRTHILLPHRSPLLGLVLMVLTSLSGLCSSGCATYTDTVREAQLNVAAGQPEPAVEMLNKQLEVDRAEDLPREYDADDVLLLLERATLLQAMGEYRLSARDMIIADQRLEYLDIGASDAAEIATYLYSDDATTYRAPPYERLLLNTLNMVNFLALDDVQSARVEARRFTLMEQFFLDDSDRAVIPELLAVGNYLGGLSFELSRDWDAAARYYSRAWAFGARDAELRRRLIDLYRLTGYKARGLDPATSGLEPLMAEAQGREPLTPAQYTDLHLRAQIVVVAQSGMVPFKRPERLPIGLALTYASSHRHRYSMSASERAQAQRLAVDGALKWVNFPTLTRSGLPVDRGVAVQLDGRPVEADVSTSVAGQVEAAWNRLQGPLLAAAITRMITRIIAGQATRVATQEIAKGQGAQAGAAGALGWLAGALIEGAMTAADTPDTRSWTTLPATIRITRRSVTPGPHKVGVRVGGKLEERMVDAPQTGAAVVNFSRNR